MTHKIDTAVILAAGLGSRLKERTKEMPKAFLEIDGKTLIERSIKNLIAQGITKIIIGTGYLNHFFDDLKLKYPQITTYKNDDYAQTGSMYTLYNLRHLIKSDFLLLEGDLLYEKAALQHILTNSNLDVILASGKTYSNDEVYIEASDEWFLKNMSKNKNELNHISGELVGINKISKSTFDKMCAYCDKQYAKNDYGMHYEDNFVGIAQEVNIFIQKIEDLAWCEIDDADHLSRALNQVYPEILKNDNAF